MSRNREEHEIAMRMKSTVPDRRRGDALAVDVMSMQYQDDEKVTHLKDYLDIIMRRKWIVIIFSVMVICTVIFATVFMTPLYKTLASIQLKGNTATNIITFDVNSDTGGKETQYNILKSVNLAKKVASNIPQEYIPVEPHRDFMSSIRHFLSGFLGSDNEKVKSSSTRSVSASTILRGLSIIPVKGTSLVNIAFTSHDPVFAAVAANTVASEYINFTLESKLAPSQKGGARLEEEVNEMKSKLESSEKKLNDFISKSQFLYVKNDVDYENTLTQRLGKLSTELDKASSERISKESIFDEVKRTGIDYDVILGNSMIQSLTMDIIKLETEYSQLLKIHKPEYPRMMRLREQINETKAQIENEKQKIINTIESDYKLALKREKSLSRELDNLRKEVNVFQKSMGQFQILKRDVETNRELYKTLLQRFKEVDISSALMDSEVHIIDKAPVPRSPFKPNWFSNISLSVIFGLFGGVFLAFFAEYFDDTIKSDEDISKVSRLPMLGKVPALDAKNDLKDRVPEHNAAFEEAFRSISTCIQFSNADKPPKQILITSPMEQEGKTLVSSSIARSLISAQERGIIIDADMRRPDLHDLYNIDNTNGLSSFLAGVSEFDGLVKKTPYIGLDVIAAGPAPPNPSELLNSSRMKELIDALSAVYDYIIIDSPPVMGISDSLVLSTVSQGVIVVVKANSTPKEALMQANYSLRSVNAKMLGVILNGVDIKKKYAHSSYYNSPYLQDEGETKKIL